MKKSIIPKIFLLASPLLLFVLLAYPYNILNSEIIVEWLGCGCPVASTDGILITSSFNANDFTALFWSIIALISTAISIPLSKKILADKKWVRIVYIAGIFVISVYCAFFLFHSMMWS